MGPAVVRGTISAMIRLLILSGGKTHRDETFPSQEITVGRTNANVLCLPESGVSARHCVIRRLSSGYELEDLESTNGSYVNRRKVRGRVPISASDEIIVANFTIRIVEANTTREPAPVSGGLKPPATQIQYLSGGSDQAPGLAPVGASDLPPMVGGPEVPQPSAASKTFVPPVLPPEESLVAPQMVGETWSKVPIPAPESEAASVPMPAAPPSSPLPQPVDKPGAFAAPFPSGPVGPGMAPQPDIGSAPAPTPGMADSPRPSSPMSSPGLAAGGAAAAGAGLSWPLPASAGEASGGGSHNFLAGSEQSEVGISAPSEAERLLAMIDPMAQAWAHGGRSSDMLLSEHDLNEARAWLNQPTMSPRPQRLHRAFIRASYRHSMRSRLRWMWVPVGLLGAVALAIGISAWVLGGGEEAALPGFDPASAPREDARPKSASAGRLSTWIESDPEVAVLASIEMMSRGAQGDASERWATETSMRQALRKLSAEVLWSQSQPLSALTVLPKGQGFAVGGEDGSIVVFRPSVDEAPKPLASHPRAIRQLFVTPDGKYLLSWSEDGTVRRWDLRADDPEVGRAELLGQEGEIVAAAMSPDGQWMAVAGFDRNIRVWPLGASDPNAASRISGKTKAAITALRFVNGYLVSGDATGRILTWSPTSDKPVAKQTVATLGESITGIEATPDGQWLIVSGAERKTARFPRVRDAWGPAKDLGELSATGGKVVVDAKGRFAASLLPGGKIRVWDPRTALPDRAALSWSHDGKALSAMQLGPDGRFLAAADVSGALWVWNLEQKGRAQGRRLEGSHGAAIRQIAFDLDSKRILSVGSDGTLRAWDYEEQGASDLSWVGRGHRGRVRGVSIDNSSTLILSGADDRSARLWKVGSYGELRPKRVLRGHKTPVTAVALHPSGHFAYAAGQDGSILRWDLRQDDAKPLRINYHSSEIYAMRVTADGEWLITAGGDARLLAFQIVNGDLAKPKPLSGHNQAIFTMVTDNSLPQLVSGGQDRRVVYWNLGGGQAKPTGNRFKGHEKAIWALALSDDGRYLASGGEDHQVHLRQLGKSDVGVLILKGHQATISALAFGPQGKWLASGGGDQEIYVWNIQSENPNDNPLRLKGHKDGVKAITFVAPDRLMSAGADGRMFLWDLRFPDAPIELLGHQAGVSDLVLSKDRRYVVSSSQDHSIRLWPVEDSLLFAAACRHLSRELNEHQWAELLPGARIRPICPRYLVP